MREQREMKTRHKLLGVSLFRFLAVLICALTHFSSYFSQHLLIMPNLMCSAACLICYAVQPTASPRQKWKRPFEIPHHIHRDHNWLQMNTFSKSDGGRWVRKVKYPFVKKAKSNKIIKSLQ